MSLHVQVDNADDVHETVAQRDAVIGLLDAIDMLIEGPVVEDVNCLAVISRIVFFGLEICDRGKAGLGL